MTTCFWCNEPFWSDNEHGEIKCPYCKRSFWCFELTFRKIDEKWVVIKR